MKRVGGRKCCDLYERRLQWSGWLPRCGMVKMNIKVDMNSTQSGSGSAIFTREAAAISERRRSMKGER